MDGTSVTILVIAGMLCVLTLGLVYVFSRGDDGGEIRGWHDGGPSAGGNVGDSWGPYNGMKGNGKPADPPPPAKRVWNVATRGDPEEYEMLGVLYAVDGNTAEAQRNNVLPLWGRQTYQRASMWNYYVVLDNRVHLPLNLEGKSCEAALGCKELPDGQLLQIDQLGDVKYKFTKNNEPAIRYNPYDY